MPVSTDTVAETVFSSLEEFGAEPEALSREATFEALDIDSLDLAELSQIVDEKYGVVIKGEDMENLKTVGDVIDFIAARAS